MTDIVEPGSLPTVEETPATSNVPIASPFAGLAEQLIRAETPYESFPPILTHYTTAEGVMGILGCKSLRFSDTRFVNDGSERTWGLLILDEVLKNMRPSLDEVTNGYAQRLRERVELESKIMHTAIFCLSDGNNLLNQWRDYGRDVVTYSIDFSVYHLVEQNKFNFPIMIFKMIYDTRKQIEMMTDLILGIIEKAKGIPKENADTEEKISMFVLSAAAEISWLAFNFKNSAFEAEREWRLWTWIQKIVGSNPPKFRSSPLGIVPYFEWKPTDDSKLPIRHIFVGPSPNSQVTDQALSVYLHHSGYSGVETSYSLIPLRR